ESFSTREISIRPLNIQGFFSFLLLSLAFPCSSFTLESNYCFCYNAAWLLYSYRFHLPGSHLAAGLGLRTTGLLA
ncbi:unnamed protein product, partial [Callosobruchus maculatus]